MYEELEVALRKCVAVHSDETGWRIGTLAAWLWVFTNAEWLKQKCVAHLLRNLSDIEDSKTGRAVCFSRDVTALLREVLALQKEKPTLIPEVFAQRAADLETCWGALIDENRRMTDPDNLRFVRRLHKHRPHLLRFQYVEGLDAPNNQAERQLRPGVITSVQRVGDLSPT